MPGFGDLFQKAVYLGVGLASYAGEKASQTLAELRVEAQKLADEMVKRGEMSTEEARRFVEETINQAQKATAEGTSSTESANAEPRQIEILDAEEEESVPEDSVNHLRQQVQDLQEQLRRLRRD